MIKMQNVKKSFGKTEVLKDISLNINQGEIYGLIGHSGAGKSTLLRRIHALEDYNEGSIKVISSPKILDIFPLLISSIIKTNGSLSFTKEL